MNAQAGYTVGDEHPATVRVLPDHIAGELESAAAADEQAREHRRRAGRLLAQLRATRGPAWLDGLALDESTALMLVEQAHGSRPLRF